MSSQVKSNTLKSWETFNNMQHLVESLSEPYFISEIARNEELRKVIFEDYISHSPPGYMAKWHAALGILEEWSQKVTFPSSKKIVKRLNCAIVSGCTRCFPHQNVANSSSSIEKKFIPSALYLDPSQVTK